MRSSKHQCEGFSLLEMIVVLVILAMISGVGAHFARPSPSRLSLDSAALNIAAHLRSARTQAMQTNLESTFTIDVEKRRYWTEKLPESSDIPSSASVSLYSASSERLQETVGRLRFFADGSSTGGRIDLQMLERRIRVTVDWMTGATRIEKEPVSPGPR